MKMSKMMKIKSMMNWMKGIKLNATLAILLLVQDSDNDSGN